jgi:glutaredoxin
VRADPRVARLVCAASRVAGGSEKEIAVDVVIYTNTGCSACHQAKEFLAQHKVSFVEKSIADDPAARDELVSLGFRAVPVIRVGNETMLGFSAVKLRKMLGL